MEVRGAHAIVTGGSSGIGAATAALLAARGARVSLVARRQGPLDDVAARLRSRGASVRTAAVDVGDQVAIAAAVASLEDAQGPCDVLITSAGQSRPGRFLELDDATFGRLMTVNYYGTLWPLRAVLPGMVARRRGSVVAVASAAAIVGVYGFTAYGASKFAVRGLMEALRGEVGPAGVHVGLCCPADVDTPMLAEEMRYKPAETAAISGAISPLAPERVAQSILRGIGKERFWIIPDTRTMALLRGSSLGWEVIARVMDRSAAKVRR